MRIDITREMRCHQGLHHKRDEVLSGFTSHERWGVIRVYITREMRCHQGLHHMRDEVSSGFTSQER